MSLDRKSSLRVLYTINASPQYILAKSHTRVPITVIPTEDSASQNTSKPLYANVLLKTCLNTIRRSSPELTHDRNRDFSIYVLDPLESNSAPAPVQISNAGGDSSSSNNAPAAEQPRGVAVGLGLMSWALAADDSDATTATGTLVKQANGQEALEVIFALRETVAMQKPSWSVQPSSSQPSSSQENFFNLVQVILANLFIMQTRSSDDLTRETLASIQMRAKAKVKPPKPIKQSTIPATESDKLMNADTYIGPLRKKGRPRTTGGDNKPTVTHTNAVASGSAPTPTSTSFSISTKSSYVPHTSNKKRSNQYPVGSPFTTRPLVRRATNPEPIAPPTVAPATIEVKAEPQGEPNLLGLLTYLSAASSSESATQNAAVLAALNTIDSSGKAEENTPNPALIAALRQLLTAYTVNSPTPPITEPPKSHHQKNRKGLSGSQILDSSSAIVSSSSSDPSVQLPHYHERHVQSLGPSARSNENSSQRPSLTEPSLASNSDKTVRKRTLSDFMDERENRSNKGKGKVRERVEKRDGHRHTESQRVQPPKPTQDLLRHYPRLAASNLPRTEPACNNYYRMPLESMTMTSPARPRPDFDDKSSMHENAAAGSSTASSSRTSSTSPRHAKVSASSPVRGPRNEARKKYVVPEWARTNTSTQPRLSEEAHKALEEVEERKKRERSAARKRLPSVQAKLKNKGAAKSDANSNENAEPLAPPPPPKPDASRGPITAITLPVVASADIVFPFVTSTRASSPPPQPNVLAKTPRTPSRDRHHPRPTPGAENDSLFTPVMGSGSLFGSAHSYTCRTPLPPPSILTSPLGNRKKAKLTPMRSALTGKSFAWTTSSSAPSSDSKAADDEIGSNKPLDKELQDALEDLECPPSSLPVASSDIDVDEEEHTQDGEFDIGDDAEFVLVKQHWAGLPPSSPPPPSSPMLLPEMRDNDIQDDDEMDELPIATSDSETDAEMNETTGGETDDVQSPTDVAEGQTAFSTFFMPSDFTTSEFPNSSELFEQYTNINDQSDFFPNMGEIDMSDPNFGAIFQQGLENIDFTEFWETFKPMVNDSLQPLQGISNQPNFDMGQDSSAMTSFGDIDHAKLADEVQSLFSGCLM
ncbi:hypothetical protein CPB84DRAFT_1748335 [Gymnopilus junonius]|uniref:Ams2/SPT21 N-terminal domain-containing protein n=1 Tax=Gymnopilus junonius TaxID=109634 RepID=A0A9P5TKY3_GYMJU|nr:hypothetical protein CPB84DRAFT_1748335 [Gymnopilus junonius]